MSIRPRTHGASGDAPVVALSGFAAQRLANAQTFTNNAYTLGTYDTEEFDDDGAFVHTTGIFTAIRSGLYIFSGCLAVTGLDSGERAICALFKNGTAYRAGITSFSSAVNQDIAAHVSAEMRLTPGDTVDLRINHIEGADSPQSLSAEYNWFSGAQLR